MSVPSYEIQEHDQEVMRLKHTGWEALEEQKQVPLAFWDVPHGHITPLAM